MEVELCETVVRLELEKVNIHIHALVLTLPAEEYVIEDVSASYINDGIDLR